jgi:hypothetical protein
VVDGFDDREVDERGGEAWKERAVGVAGAGEADYGLREKSVGVDVVPTALEVRIQGLHSGKRQLGIVEPL